MSICPKARKTVQLSIKFALWILGDSAIMF